MSIGSKDELSEECLLRLAHDNLKADYAELEKLYQQQLRRTDKLEADYEELENQRDELRNALNETMLGYDMWLETNGYSYENYDNYKQLLARIKDGEK